MQSALVRKQFLKFFAERGHQIVPSAPMVIKNDPTLMFTNAGMNQFKDIFLGISPAKDKRVADTQKCLRVSGKHNDLEEVGVDTYHHTMFEMLGNWSFGDYFKKEAIAWAWELLTEVYKIEKDRLYVTVFEGDESEGLAFDQESHDLWKQFISEDRILKGSKKDNFWEMGDTGPCGPCTEIHVDMRSEAERKKTDGKNLVNADHPQVIEIWNNVFMEFNRKADSSLEPLPAKHVDTGMGFERLCMVLQGKQSTYDTDVFTPLIAAIESMSGHTYGQDKQTDIAMRVISDHIRTIAFAIADGQLPESNKAGYVIRRILRRAVRYGYTFLGLHQAFMYNLVDILIQIMGEAFTELISQKDLIINVIHEEENSFLRTLANGINRFQDYLKKHKAESEINGSFAFELYDTYGFPIDLTALMAREQGLGVDMKGFDNELALQKERSRSSTAIAAGDWVVLAEDDRQEFIGYTTTEADVKIVKYREVSAKGKKQIHLVFNLSPFYAESGGQVGDTGVLVSETEEIKILDTRKEHGLNIHFADILPSNPHAIFKARVDLQRRKDIMANHSATHLLHAALRTVLGNHVEQKGSLVAPDYLRFDFSHYARVEAEDLKSIENMVNSRIMENIQSSIQEMPLNEAMQLGAMALFGEKYGDVVRVVMFDPAHSIELCGGTHVPATGSIGYFKIISESAVAAGVRRIEAVTGNASSEFIRSEIDTVNAIRQMLRTGKDPVSGVSALQDENSQLRRKIEHLMKEKAGAEKQRLISVIKQGSNGLSYLVSRVELDNPDLVKTICFELKQQFPNLVILLAHLNNEKPMLAAAGGEQAIEAGFNAVSLIREVSSHIQGGGGGQPFFATAGGKNSEGIDAALDAASNSFGL